MPFPPLLHKGSLCPHKPNSSGTRRPGWGARRALCCASPFYTASGGGPAVCGKPKETGKPGLPPPSTGTKVPGGPGGGPVQVQPDPLQTPLQREGGRAAHLTRMEKVLMSLSSWSRRLMDWMIMLSTRLTLNFTLARE